MRMGRKSAPRRAAARSGVRLAADIGGTFTDIAVFDDRSGKLVFGKALSTPGRLVDGISHGVQKAGSDYRSAGLFLHGSTVAINTVLERTGARTALIITEGFRDIYEIGRINRPDAYNLFFQKHVPLVERALRFEVKERVLADGEIDRPLDEAEIARLGEQLARIGIEACAILFLNCYAKSDHEARAKAILEADHPDMFVSASHELSQEYREFERCSTVVANAYIGPKVRRYIGEIEEHIRGAGFAGSFLIVQSTGGLYEADQARSQCIRMLESGPAAGVIGTQALCRSPQDRQCDRLRHGRHHRQGRRDLQGRGADHRHRALRRLRPGAAGADRHDGYFRGRHRRRLDRPGRGGRPAGRAAERRRRTRAGLLWARRQRADRHRCQSGSRPARR